MFEYRDPIYEANDRLYQATGRGSHNDASVRLQEAAAIREEMDLLAPLYGNDRNRSRFIKLAIPTRTTLYHFLEKHPIRWPRVGYSKDWESARAIHIAAVIEHASTESIAAFRSVFQQWTDLMHKLLQLNQVYPVVQSNRNVEFACEFTESCGDPAMALYMLLTHTRKMTSVESVGFFIPSDTDRQYLSIGRSAKR